MMKKFYDSAAATNVMVFLVEFHTRVDLLTVLTYLGKLGALNSTARTKECKHRGASKHPKRSKKSGVAQWEKLLQIVSLSLYASEASIRPTCN